MRKSSSQNSHEWNVLRWWISPLVFTASFAAIFAWQYFWSSTFRNFKRNAGTATMRIQCIGFSFLGETEINFFSWTFLTDKWHMDKNRYSTKEETPFYELNFEVHQSDWDNKRLCACKVLFFLSKDKVYKDIEAEILPKVKDILRTKPSLRFEEKKFLFTI